jgi:nitrate/TMAO reductase-like tetraheme cytochrome c subunit
MLTTLNPRRTVNQPSPAVNIPQTCGKCHSTEANEFMQSIHGQAIVRGVSRSPVCTDCHGIHSINTAFDHATSTASTAVATESCAKCHEGRDVDTGIRRRRRTCQQL